ncbi:tail fiber domain-containing protein [Sediminimonas sp.]|uniref:tail fiber domain-containing protein n=1 Tax=Sediminimonas sp. TaxID=2823379 RepID=UPI0025F6049B|nr:tail fiber domain-containing protein [Sediminimonas sp.]
MGKPSPPKPDKRIGEAALKSAAIGEDYLAFMKDQAAITNDWAAEDRSRYRSVFQPLQDEYIADSQGGPDYGKVAGDARRAKATAAHQFNAAQGQQERRLASMGVDPRSGRFGSATRSSELAEAAATAGAANDTRLKSRAMAENKSDTMKANAINMGSGMAVNPGTSMGLSNAASGAGFQGAMQGQRQKGSLLNTQYQQQMQQYNAQMSQSSSLWGGLGSLAGLALTSSKDAKTNKKPVERSLLKAVEKMPVEEWDYKPGEGDGGSHVGAYAEDFKAATGKGDGRSINVVDALGVTMGAVQELSQKVDKIGNGKTRRKPKSRSIAGVAA